MTLKHSTIILSVILVILIGGSMYLVWNKDDATPTTNTMQIEPPRVIGVDELQPEEVLRVYLQAWFRRDFGSQYALLTPTLQSATLREDFITRADEALPVIAGIQIANIHHSSTSDIQEAIDLEMTVTLEDETIQSKEVTVSFEKTVGGWRISEVPALF